MNPASPAWSLSQYWVAGAQRRVVDHRGLIWPGYRVDGGCGRVPGGRGSMQLNCHLVVFPERKSRNMRAAEVMTRHVVTVAPEATIETAARLMLDTVSAASR